VTEKKSEVGRFRTQNHRFCQEKMTMPRKDSELIARVDALDRFADAHKTVWQIPKELNRALKKRCTIKYKIHPRQISFTVGMTT
jgi:hypothetical protein